MLDFSLLNISRLAIHHIHPRGPDRSLVAPELGQSLVRLPARAEDMFNRRIARALGRSSNGIRMDFQRIDAGSFFQRAAQSMRCADDEFLNISHSFAQDLSNAQLSGDYAPSKLIVMSGTCGELQRPYCAVVKADMQDGLGEKKMDDQTIIEHLDKIFFTETQRLYKIGFIQQNVATPAMQNGLFSGEQFIVHLFDHLMTGTETRGPALYFHNAFMGTSRAATDKRLTREFFDKTRAFFDSQDLATDQRLELMEALRSELRSKQQTIGVAEFGAKHLDADLQNAYLEFMQRAKFPDHAVTKDVEFIEARLKKRRKASLTSDVQIFAPADKFNELIKIESTEDGNTILTIQGTIESIE
jgi:hypothetical protein